MPSNVPTSSLRTDQDVVSCPICGDLLVEVEAGLHRIWGNVILTSMLTSFGSSVLAIRLPDKDWMPFMFPGRSARALHCTRCGSLTVAPSIEAHREKLGLEP